MAHMDASGGMDTMAGDVPDFSDVRREIVEMEFSPDCSGGKVHLDVAAPHEPLWSDGGLEQDEIAEVYYLDTALTLGLDAGGGSGSTEVNNLEVRGGIGINTEALPVEVPGNNVNRENAVSDFIIDEQPNNGIDSGSAQIQAGGVDVLDEQGMLQHFTVNTEPGYDGSSSPAGPGSPANQRFFTNYRQLYNHGPALDTTDDLAFIFDIVEDNFEGRANLSIQTEFAYIIHDIEHGRGRYDLP